MFIDVKEIYKSYGTGSAKTDVLKGATLSVSEGELCVILGSSGSGKSTLLNCIGGLDEIDAGSIVVNGNDISKIKSKKLFNYRREMLGFIFQEYNLIPNLTVQENIEVGKYISKNPLDIEEVLETVGLKDQRNKLPNTLSGGQQQRTAIARAIIKNPAVLLCDEPTGALDSHTAKEILCFLETINKKYNTTILLVTHNQEIRRIASQVVTMRDGVITDVEHNPCPISARELEAL